MANFLKIAGIAIGGVLAAVIVFLLVVDLGFLKPRVEAAVTDATGREFRIDGDLSIKALPSPRVVVENATLANAPWASGQEMLSIGHFSTKVGLWSLISGPIVVHELAVDDVAVNLEASADGDTNWTFEPSADAEEPDDESSGSLESPIDLRHAEVRNVRVVYRRPEVDDLDFLLENFDVDTNESGGQDFNAAANLDDLPLSVEGSLADHIMELVLDIGDVNVTSTTHFRDSAADFELSLATLDKVGTLIEIENLPEEDLSLKGDVSLNGEEVSLTGILAEVGSVRLGVDGIVNTAESTADLQVNLEGSNLDVFKPDLPEIPFALEASVDLAEKSIDLDPYELTIGESELEGAVHAELEDVPVINLSARSAMFDLSPFFPEEEEESGDAPEVEEPEPDADALVFKDEPLPLDMLQKAVADIDVQIDRLKTTNTEYTDFVLQLKLEDGVLDLENGFQGQHGGTFENKIGMQYSDTSADLDISLSATDMKLVVLAGDGIEPELAPASSVEVDLKASGGTPHALASSADGKLVFLQGPGRVDNTMIGKVSGDIISQLFGALNPFAKDEPYSNWECSAFQVDFDTGEGEISTFLLQGEKIMVVGGGDIDMETEKLNVEFNTKPRAGVGVSADMFVTPFVALSGTLANPHVGLNAKGALLSGGAAVLTGGLSFLYQGLADRATAESGKCEETFGAIDAEIPGS